MSVLVLDGGSGELAYFLKGRQNLTLICQGEVLSLIWFLLPPKLPSSLGRG